MGFDIAPYGEAIAKVSELATGVLQRVLPVKMSEAEKAGMQQQVTMELLKEQWDGVVKEFDDRASARALAQADVAKGNWFTNVLAATVRPVFGYVAMLSFFAPLAARMTTSFLHHTFTPEQLAALTLNPLEQQIVLTVIYFYFGGRVVERITPAVTSMVTGKK